MKGRGFGSKVGAVWCMVFTRVTLC